MTAHTQLEGIHSLQKNAATPLYLNRANSSAVVLFSILHTEPDQIKMENELKGNMQGLTFCCFTLKLQSSMPVQ